MKQQVVHIHGGDPFDSYEEYISFLKNFEIKNLDYFKKKRWGTSLQKNLGENFEVLNPDMPNKRNAKYLEWKIWFEKIVPLLDDEVILAGGSLGGIFLIKYLSENILTKKIKGLFIAAAPYAAVESKYSLADFVLGDNLGKVSDQVKNIYFYHSKDDPVVPYQELEKYKKQFPDAKFTTFEDRGHFLQEEFPEVVRDIIGLN